MGQIIYPLKIVLLMSFIILSVQGANNTCYNTTLCTDGVLIPKWSPVNVNLSDSVVRAMVYFIALMYSFLGVSIIADRFMAAIERITSQENEVNIKTKTGENVIIRVRVWNETVSNLTLMALGSSAPEILLSIIEICGKNFEAGTLGPGTIVGSAAFNLFIIIGICILVVPSGETRKIKHLPVFIVTATFSVVAYVWLYLIIGVISVGVIEIWEAIVTFLMFPVTVILAYLADKRLFINQFGDRRYLINRKSKTNTEENNLLRKKLTKDAEEFENLREQYIYTIKELRKMHPGTSLQVIEHMAITEVATKSKKSRAFYKMMGTRMLTGGGNIMNQRLKQIKQTLDEDDVTLSTEDTLAQRIFFDPVHYIVLENVGSVSITVKRSGGFLGSTVYVDYKTNDETATAGSDYIKSAGLVCFLPYECEKTILIPILDDDIFEEDEHFSVNLWNLKVENGREENGFEYEISKTNKATIMILDDDHPGVFYFESLIKDFSESCGRAAIIVRRAIGARGIVRVPFQTKDGTAKSGSDYTAVIGNLIFDNEEVEKTIYVTIFDDEDYEKNEYFLIQLGEPTVLERIDSHFEDQRSQGMKTEDKLLTEGKPKLGEWSEIKVNIHENVEFKDIVDKCVKNANLALTYGASTWKEQFIDAVTVKSSEFDEDGREMVPSLSTFILHYLTLFWKLLFACVPPTEYFGGWLCFIVSIMCIGFLTAIIGDLASSFGCSIGLLDEVTAITFVAIGTSLPDTFASKVAAINDSTADSSIGNVTGSNAVNVFLGLGVAWTMAAIVHACRGTVFLVPLGSLGFSVTLFCVLALCAIAVIVIRRLRCIGGELGGPPLFKIISGGILFGFFIIYVLMSSLRAYCLI